MKRNIGIALIAGGVGYTLWRFWNASSVGVGPKQEWAIFKTSGAVPCAAAVGLGAYLVWG